MSQAQELKQLVGAEAERRAFLEEVGLGPATTPQERTGTGTQSAQVESLGLPVLLKKNRD